MNQEMEGIKIRIAEVKPILTTLEWDINRDQINPGKLSYYKGLKAEYDGLIGKLRELQNEDNW